MATKSKSKKLLNPVNIQLLLKNAYKIPKLKTAIINEIGGLGLAGFIQKQFRLTPHQKNELNTIKDRDVENVFNKSIIAALSRNGKIELINEGHNPANLSVNFYARWGSKGPEVGVTITC